jgi:ATP-dependent Clp protease ATP-binding subunit ClpA
VFSASLEIVLAIAYREAVSRRHAYLTLEHLLFALAHDQEGRAHPDGVRRRIAETPQRS